MTSNTTLRCACLVAQRGSALLLVRARENQHWYLPGGKVEEGESAAAALARELREELGIELDSTSMLYLYTVVGPAYDRPGLVELICYAAEWGGTPRAQGEISEVGWLDVSDTNRMAPAVQLLCTDYLQCGPAEQNAEGETRE